MPDLLTWTLCALFVAAVWALALFDVEDRVFWWAWRRWLAPQPSIEAPEVVRSGEFDPESRLKSPILASSERLLDAHLDAQARWSTRNAVIRRRPR